MTKIKNFIRNLSIILFKVKFVRISIRDPRVEDGKVKNTAYPGRDCLVSWNVPIGKVVNFQKSQFIKESIAYIFNGKPVLFEIAGFHYIYDIESGDLLEIVIYSNLIQ